MHFVNNHIRISAFLVVGAFWLSLSSNAQTLSTKDGVSLGDRKEFVDACIGAAKESSVNVQGVQINMKRYCHCVANNLIPRIYYSEFMTAVSKDSLVQLFMRPDLLQEILECSKDNTKIDDDFVIDSTSDSELTRLAAVQECVNTIKSTPSASEVFKGNKAEEYCNCAVTKMFENGYSFAELNQASNPESAVYKEVVYPCVMEVLNLSGQAKVENSYDKNDIVGNPNSTRIPLTFDEENIPMLSMSIAGEAISFYLDDSTTDVIISEEMQRDLLFKHPELVMTYVGTKEFQLSETEFYSANMVKLESVRVGEFTVKNLIIAIIPEMPPICGIGLLSKFSSWDIDEANKTITLRK